MAKKKQVKTNALRLLEQKKISHQEQSFEIDDTQHLTAGDVAERLGIPAENIFKTLVAVGNKTGYLVAVIPSNHELDLKKLAKASGNKKVEMLPLKELETVTGYIRGGCSPLGMKKQFPTYLHQSAETLEVVYVSAGKRGLQMSLNPQDLKKVVGAHVADIVQG
ncbi:Cys-tRNA(Pro) deacylase [Vagococcus elongatus]|uniref:Cys-tRNA(Pro)/Cys-tRNA(Cys) deacylase n=1 Tax=Vagococcus elongatus TaxID=180344 RepID=A0A430AP02_9ENTE|nr:Cys-tRNA(Pro) deacylase [Vagococcus elongatus]RSU09852.1 aminoacyl-tRNA deacylase [Vagococcus elongatus]